MGLLKFRKASEVSDEVKRIILEERDGKQRGLYCRWNLLNRGMLKYWRFGYVTLLGGVSRCHGKGTKILMYNGNFKNIEDITIGEQVMGVDSTPRTILNTNIGYGKMYNIIQNKGLPYRVNEDHIISLKDTQYALLRELQGGRADATINISVKDYLTKLSTGRKGKGGRFIMYHKGWKTGVNFSKRNTLLDPYFVGLWLGDGSSHEVAITTMDKEIVDYIHGVANAIGYSVITRQKPNNKASTYLISNGKGKEHEVLERFRYYNLYKNKHIPEDYLYNDRESRLALLAGLIDSDGCYIDSKKCIAISNTNEKLASQIAYLARSLGFYCSMVKRKTTIKSLNYSGIAYTCCIYGNGFGDIPTKIERKRATSTDKYTNPLISGFKIEEDGEDDYYGFTLDRDGLYLLEDFTVTHNSSKSYMLNMIIDDFTNPTINSGYIHWSDLRIVHFGFEMKPSDEVLRTVSTKMKVSYDYLLSAKYDKTKHTYNIIEDNDIALIDEQLEKIRKKQIYYVDDVGSLDDIIDTLRFLHDKNPNAKIVITIDHNLLIKRGGERDEIELVSNTGQRAIEIVKKWGDMIIIVSQLNGNIESPSRMENKNLHYPIRTDIHGSNQLFNACDNVIIVHKPSNLNITHYGTEELQTMFGSGGNEGFTYLIHGAWIKRRFGVGGHLWFIDDLKNGEILETSKESLKKSQIKFAL